MWKKKKKREQNQNNHVKNLTIWVLSLPLSFLLFMAAVCRFLSEIWGFLRDSYTIKHSDLCLGIFFFLKSIHKAYWYQCLNFHLLLCIPKYTQNMDITFLKSMGFSKIYIQLLKYKETFEKCILKSPLLTSALRESGYIEHKKFNNSNFYRRNNYTISLSLPVIRFQNNYFKSNWKSSPVKHRHFDNTITSEIQCIFVGLLFLSIVNNGINQRKHKASSAFIFIFFVSNFSKEIPFYTLYRFPFSIWIPVNKDRSKLQRKRRETEIKLYFSQNIFYLVYILCELTSSGLLLYIFL